MKTHWYYIDKFEVAIVFVRFFGGEAGIDSQIESSLSLVICSVYDLKFDWRIHSFGVDFVKQLCVFYHLYVIVPQRMKLLAYIFSWDDSQQFVV